MWNVYKLHATMESHRDNVIEQEIDPELRDYLFYGF